jgi:hypothetical protein
MDTDEHGWRRRFSYPCPSVFIRGWIVLVAAPPPCAVSRVSNPQSRRSPKAPRLAHVSPTGSRQYGRLETCATGRRGPAEADRQMRWRGNPEVRSRRHPGSRRTSNTNQTALRTPPRMRGKSMRRDFQGRIRCRVFRPPSDSRRHSKSRVPPGKRIQGNWTTCFHCGVRRGFRPHPACS